MREEIKGKSEGKRISGEAHDINKQTIYSAKVKNQIKGALHPGARTGQTVLKIINIPAGGGWHQARADRGDGTECAMNGGGGGGGIIEGAEWLTAINKQETLTAVWEDPGLNHAADSCVYRDSCCDIQSWARAVHLYCSA